MSDWSERIPAAIEKAEKVLNGRHDALGLEGARGFVNLTATEVALAKALWRVLGGSPVSAPSQSTITTLDYFDPLRAFVEKVEVL